MQMSATILFALVLFLNTDCANGQDWKKIVPLKTTRAEIEAVFGHNTGNYSVLYQLKDGRLSIVYSSGHCTPERRGRWDVPENTVISFTFSLRRPKRLSELKLDRRKFRRVDDDHLTGVVYYVSDEDGITYTIQEGRVDSIEYGPGKEYEHLYCKDSPNLNQNP